MSCRLLLHYIASAGVAVVGVAVDGAVAFASAGVAGVMLTLHQRQEQ